MSKTILNGKLAGEQPMDITSIASRFVDFVLKYGQWKEIKTLSPDEVQVLFDIVSAAGFEPKEVVPGRLVGHCREQDGCKTGETYPINRLCPFKVISREDVDHYFATGWLDCAFRLIYDSMRRKENRENFREGLINIITDEIKKSIPFTPIQLTSEGDILCECPPNPLFLGYEYFVNHARDNRSINSCAGVHGYCNGFMDRMRATKTHDAIVCRKCHLRALFPKEVKTYGELRQSLKFSHIQVPT